MTQSHKAKDEAAEYAAHETELAVLAAEEADTRQLHEARRHALELAFTHMRGVHHDEAIAAARAILVFLKDG